MKDFPYVSLCGPERNYVRCDDLPVVFTKIVEKEDSETGETKDWFGYAHAEELLMVGIALTSYNFAAALVLYDKFVAGAVSAREIVYECRVGKDLSPRAGKGGRNWSGKIKNRD